MRTLLLLLVLPLVLLAAAGAWYAFRPADGPTWREVALTRGSVVREAVAVGRLEPIFEIPVTPTNGGVVTRIFVEPGQRVAQGDPLVEVRPVLTDAQRLAAERALAGARDAEADVLDIQRGANLLGKTMRLLQGRDSLDRMKTGAERARSSAEEQLTLLLEGEVQVDGLVIDWIVRAPNAGHVLQLDAEVGMRVVPASTFGAGTPLCVLGDLDRPVFRGTVDEIDVGLLREGMAARVTLGAVPGARLSGTLTEVSLRGERRDSAVSFPVELAVERPEGLVVRAGYSAVARIEVARVDDALLLPERLVTFDGDAASVLVRGDDGEPVARTVELGLGDGLVIEVRDGLAPGDDVLERVD